MSEEHLVTLISEEQIRRRIAELATEIRDDLGNGVITCIGLLKGSFIFLSDLVRAMGGPLRCEFLDVVAYHGGTRSSGAVRITADLRHPIEGQDCLLVVDVIDTARTVAYLKRLLEVRSPRSMKVCTLLDKPSGHETPLEIAYKGFTIADNFVVGYGLDLNEIYRNLPYIATYSP